MKSRKLFSSTNGGKGVEIETDIGVTAGAATIWVAVEGTTVDIWVGILTRGWLVVEQLTKNVSRKRKESFLSVILIYVMLPPNGLRYRRVGGRG
jgi:hypothetical protein